MIVAKQVFVGLRLVSRRERPADTGFAALALQPCSLGESDWSPFSGERIDDFIPGPPFPMPITRGVLVRLPSSTVVDHMFPD